MGAPVAGRAVLEALADGGADLAQQGRVDGQRLVQSLEDRDTLVSGIVAAVRAARTASFGALASIAPDQFGTEVLLADGCLASHGTGRYLAALEGILARAEL